MTMPSRHANLESANGEGALFLALPPVVQLDDDQFYELCRLNGELRIERAAGGGLEPASTPHAVSCSIMPPAGGETSRRNAEIDPQRRDVYVHRPGASVECLRAPEYVSAGPSLTGFSLALTEIW